MSFGMCFGVALGSAFEGLGISTGFCIGTLADHQFSAQIVKSSSANMDIEQFNTGVVVYMDEDDDIEQAYEKEND